MRQRIALYLPLLVLAAVVAGCTGNEPSTPASPAGAPPAGRGAADVDGDLAGAKSVSVLPGGTMNVGILLVEFDDTPADRSFLANQPDFADQLAQKVEDPDYPSLHALYRDMTAHLPEGGGRLGFTADVVGTYVIPNALDGGCSETTGPVSRRAWLDAAVDSATAAGDLPGPYDLLMVVVSTDNSCAAWNTRVSEAYRGDSPPAVVISGWQWSDNDIGHEVGHLLGFGHSGDTVFEYWDFTCVMGENTDYSGAYGPSQVPVPPRHLNAIWKLVAGYIDPATEMRTIDAPGTYTAYLSPSEHAPGEGAPTPDGSDDRVLFVEAGGASLYVSYRQPDGLFDVDEDGVGAWEIVMNRVHVHRYAPDQTRILAVLEEGQSYEAPDVRITALGDGLTRPGDTVGDVDWVPVLVEIAVPDCSGTVDIVYGTDTVIATTAPKFAPYFVSFSAEITNLNSPACADLELPWRFDPVTGVFLPNPSGTAVAVIESGSTAQIMPSMELGTTASGRYAGNLVVGPRGAEIPHLFTYILDTTPPAAPTGLGAAFVAPAAAALAWNEVVDDVAGIDHYLVRRDGAAPVAVAGTAWNDALPGDGTYVYQVAAVDLAGRTSAWSGGATLVVDTTAPAVPGGLAGAVDCGQVTLTWDASTDAGTGVDHYVVLRDGTAAGTSPTATFVTLLPELVNGQSVTYQVQAVDGAGNVSAAGAGWAFGAPIAISAVTVSRIPSLDCTLTVTWHTDVPTSGEVEFGLSCGNQTRTATDGLVAYDHAVECDVSGLTTFAYTIRAADGCVTVARPCASRTTGKCISQ